MILPHGTPKSLVAGPSIPRDWSAPRAKRSSGPGAIRENLNERITLATDLNVFADFKPKLPEKYRQSKNVFLANIAPDLQRDVFNRSPSGQRSSLSIP